MHHSSEVRLAAFQARVAITARTLHELGIALLGSDSERALGQAVRARRSILATYARWAELDEREQAAPAFVGVRHFGHRILAGRLHASSTPVSYARDSELEKRACDVALLAVLWKIADALDRLESDVS